LRRARRHDLAELHVHWCVAGPHYRQCIVLSHRLSYIFDFDQLLAVLVFQQGPDADYHLHFLVGRSGGLLRRFERVSGGQLRLLDRGLCVYRFHSAYNSIRINYDTGSIEIHIYFSQQSIPELYWDGPGFFQCAISELPGKQSFVELIVLGSPPIGNPNALFKLILVKLADQLLGSVLKKTLAVALGLVVRKAANVYDLFIPESSAACAVLYASEEDAIPYGFRYRYRRNFGFRYGDGMILIRRIYWDFEAPSYKLIYVRSGGVDHVSAEPKSSYLLVLALSFK
jgi:hypothetical protein